MQDVIADFYDRILMYAILVRLFLISQTVPIGSNLFNHVWRQFVCFSSHLIITFWIVVWIVEHLAVFASIVIRDLFSKLFSGL